MLPDNQTPQATQIPDDKQSVVINPSNVEGTIKLTKIDEKLIIDPSNVKGVVTVDATKTKETMLQDIEEQLEILYINTPQVAKSVLKWVEVFVNSIV